MHVCTKSGAVVTQLKPTIAVQAAGREGRELPVAMMAAVGKGLGDYHYGNDVVLKPGGKVTVTVTSRGSAPCSTRPRRVVGSASGMSMG